MRNGIKLSGLLFLWLALIALPVQAEEDQPGSGDGMDRLERIAGEAGRLAERWAERFSQWDRKETGSRTYLGVVVEKVPDVLRDYVELPNGVGLLMSHITKGGPAAEAGLKDNDILVRFDGQWIVNLDQLSTLIDLKGAGSEVELEVLRKGEPVQVQVELRERGSGSDGGGAGRDEVPGLMNPPDMEELGVSGEAVDQWMESLEEWIPGSVRVFVDDNEQIHVDLSDLKEDMADLRSKMERLPHKLGQESKNLVREHGQEGARTTVVRMQERDLNYSGPDGKVIITGSEEGDSVMVWDREGTLIYEGGWPKAGRGELPREVLDLLDQVDKLRAKMDNAARQEEAFEVELSGPGSGDWSGEY